MDIGKDGAPSFDPRTWHGPTPPAPAGSADRPGRPEAADAGSYDPRSWADASPEAAPAAAAPPPPRRRPWGGWAAVLAGAAVLGVGTYVATHRPTPIPAPAVAGGTGAPAMAPAPPASSRRTFMIGDVSQLAAAIATTGLPDDLQARIGAEVAAGLGPGPGEIRISYEMIEGAAPRLLVFEATRLDGAGIAVTPVAGGHLRVDRLAANLSKRVRAVSGQMDETNFYSSAVTAGLDDSLIGEFAKALAFDFNFQTEVQPGDVFGAAVEQAVNGSGEPVGLPRLLYVSLRTQTKVRALYSFQAPGEAEPGWFDANGRSAARALMRTPVDGARITSRFGARFHPVLHFMKMHNGIDFAAPIGTPIYASGGGVVEEAQMKGANGNRTIIRHDNGWQTYYLHQSRFMPGVTPGARVSQGQKIGEIGTTGRSTGPHLHYEVHIDGRPVDPASIDTGTGVSLEGEALRRFQAERERIDRARAGAP